jgi:hypothetical protein
LPDLSRRRRLLVLGICCMSLFIVGLDSTIVNVALPSIGRELHASVSGLQWTIDAYALVLGAPHRGPYRRPARSSRRHPAREKRGDGAMTAPARTAY